MIRAAVAALLVAVAAPAAAQTFAIVNGMIAKGDGSAPIHGGMVVVRDGSITKDQRIRDRRNAVVELAGMPETQEDLEEQLS